MVRPAARCHGDTVFTVEDAIPARRFNQVHFFLVFIPRCFFSFTFSILCFI